MTNITKDLLKPEYCTEEIELMLSRLLSSAAQIDDRTIRYGDRLTVKYDKSGRKITEAHWEDGACPNILGGILEKFHMVLGQEIEKTISSQVVFFGSPITKTFRLNDIFQIIPVPPEAPQAPYLLAWHPALVEFRHPSANKANFTLIHMRASKAYEKINTAFTLLISDFFGKYKNDGTKYWVLDKSENDLKSKFLQRDYWPQANWDKKDKVGFSTNAEWTDIPLINFSEYYSRRGKVIGAEFDLPDTFEDSCNKLFSLTDDNYRMISRSAHWYDLSSKVFSQSFSLSYSCLVFAIESLIPAPPLGSPCDNCGKPQSEGATKMFKQFLDAYCNGIENSDINKMLGLRAKFVHGNSLMHSDEGGVGFRFNAAQNNDRSNLENLRRICRAVMLNWMHSQ